MKVAIMQPYFFPYIGYFQLINAVDEFILYDNIQYTKKGWINRNRILMNGQDDYISLPIRKDSDYLDVCERYLAETWHQERKKMLARLSNAYRKAPYYKLVLPVLEESILYEVNGLFEFIHHSLIRTLDYLKIDTRVVISSSINIDNSLRSARKVIALCKARFAKEYINPIGGQELYDKAEFKEVGLDLFFLKSGELIYPQLGTHAFVPWLSIIDVMMFNSQEQIADYLNMYKLV